MKIYPYAKTSYINKTAPQFRGNGRVVFDKNKKKILNGTASWFFREDLSWQQFINRLILKYKDVEKVNINIYGCSEGAEVFSVLMLLIEKLGIKKAQKFFPIQAKDIDEVILKRPMQGIITPTKNCVKNIKNNMGDNYFKYLNFDSVFVKNEELQSEVCNGKVNKILKDNVIFEQKDIMEDIESIGGKDNTIVMCRNLWPYLPAENRQILAQKIFDNLGDNSMCVIGKFDKYANAENYLINAGFKYTDIPYYFVKNSSGQIMAFENLNNIIPKKKKFFIIHENS